MHLYIAGHCCKYFCLAHVANNNWIATWWHMPTHFPNIESKQRLKCTIRGECMPLGYTACSSRWGCVWGNSFSTHLSATLSRNKNEHVIVYLQERALEVTFAQHLLGEAGYIITLALEVTSAHPLGEAGYIITLVDK